MCNMNVENIKNIIEVLSAFLTPTVAICTAIFMYQQKNIQKSQQATEIFKLRVEHIKYIFNAWGSFNTYITFIPNYKAQIIAINGNQDMIISSMERVFAELYKQNISTTSLFGENISKIEKDFIESLRGCIPNKGQDWSIYNILDEYQLCREKFNTLYDTLEKTINQQVSICV